MKKIEKQEPKTAVEKYFRIWWAGVTVFIVSSGGLFMYFASTVKI